MDTRAIFTEVALYCRSEVIMTINQELLDILACPQCKGEVKLNEQGDGLICQPCKLMYEIKDDIPIMLIEKAKKLP
jgi:uncharacterized protein YbaR (Trm112 family)